MKFEIPTPFLFLHQSPRAVIGVVENLVLAIVCLTSLSIFLTAISSPLAAQTPAKPTLQSGPQIHIGFSDHCKLGCWTPFFVRHEGSSSPTAFALTCNDGDDTPVTYTGHLRASDPKSNTFQGWLKFGRSSGAGVVKLFDRSGNQIAETSLTLGGGSSLTQIYASTQRMILTLEPEQHLAKIIESSSVQKDSASNGLTIALNDASQLPLDWFCYQGVDTVFLVTSDLERLESIGEQQWVALEKWIENGGRLVFSASLNSDALLSSGPLQRFCPGKFSGLQTIDESSRLETFSNNGQLITRGSPPISIAGLEDVKGVVVLQQNDRPLIVRQARGFGEITFVAIDLDNPRIQQWPGYSNLIHRLENPSSMTDSGQAQSAESRAGSVSHFGFQDITGQLRIALDQFSTVPFIAFTLIATLIGLYILLIGPGDYFFLKKFTGKMELTWITFPLLSLLFCCVAFGIAQMTRPATIQLKQLEVIDVDSQSGLVRGTLWGNLYSPVAGKCDITLNSKNDLGFEVESNLLSWQGLPGDGLGGMQTKIVSAIAKPGYRQTVIQPAGDPDHTHQQSNDDSNPVSMRLVGVPLYVSSTKSIFAQWNGQYLQPIRSRLIFQGGSSQLDGTITNPLDLPMSNVRLMFENYAYVLKKGELEAGETIDVLSEMRERTARSLLTGRFKASEKDNRSQSKPWEPTGTSINRIAEIMLFYQSAGGRQYTNLTHSYQSFIDMSPQVELKQAILVGEIQPRVSLININGLSDPKYDSSTTLVRIVLPVEYR